MEMIRKMRIKMWFDLTRDLYTDGHARVAADCESTQYWIDDDSEYDRDNEKICRLNEIMYSMGEAIALGGIDFSCISFSESESNRYR